MLGNRTFLISILALLALVLLLSGAVFFRVVIISEIPVADFWDILGWQAASWFPWLILFTILTQPFGSNIRKHIQNWNIAGHIIAALMLSGLNVLWFKWFSENFSPFLGLENTRYGVFPWFFIFWFFFGMLLYWGSTSYFGLVGGRNGPSNTSRATKPLIVKTGKVSEVIKPEEVIWIEAQDYYSVLHLKDRRPWIKKTMRDLEGSLDPESFIRVHRSTIININFLKQIEKGPTGKNFAIMNDGTKRPISRQGWRFLKARLKTTK